MWSIAATSKALVCFGRVIIIGTEAGKAELIVTSIRLTFAIVDLVANWTFIVVKFVVTVFGRVVEVSSIAIGTVVITTVIMTWFIVDRSTVVAKEQVAPVELWWQINFELIAFEAD